MKFDAKVNFPHLIEKKGFVNGILLATKRKTMSEPRLGAGAYVQVERSVDA